MTRNPHPRSSIPELTAGCSPAPIPSPTILRSKQITPPRYCSLPSGFSSTEDATQLWRVICSFTETAAIRAFGVCPESKEKASSFPYGNSAPSRLREGPATKTRPSCRRDRMVIGKKKKKLSSSSSSSCYLFRANRLCGTYSIWPMTTELSPGPRSVNSWIKT